MFSKIILFILILIFMPVSFIWAEELRDIKPPVELPWNYLFIYLIVAMLYLIAVFFLLKYFMKKRKARPKTELVRLQSPWEIAFDQLNELKKKDFLVREEFKEYYSCLSDIIRRYMEDRFSIKAPEMTTQEFLFYLRETQLLSGDQKTALKNFLNSCDMVKFAKYDPTISEAEESFGLAQKLIEETKGVDAPVNTTAAGAGVAK